MNKKMIAYFAGRLEWALTRQAVEPQNAEYWREYIVSVTRQAWELAS